MIKFTILGNACSMKNSRKIVSFGGRPALIKSDAAREYEESALKQIPPAARQMLEGPVRVTMRMYYSSERPDLDGALLLDIMAARYKKVEGKLIKIGPGQYARGESERVLVSRGCYINDRQCREQHFYHAIDKLNPRVEIEIEPIGPQQGALIED
jgi:Holliday junction resolvase RusA-like endonuclease